MKMIRSLSALMAAVVAPATISAQITFTFTPACTVGITPHAVAPTISQDGFTLTDRPAIPGSPAPNIVQWCTPSPNFAGPGVWSGGLGTNIRLTRDDGSPFTINSIDLARLTTTDLGDAADQIVLNFIGHVMGGGDVAQQFIIGPATQVTPLFETFLFEPQFTNLVSVDFAPERAAPQRYQFTNVQVSAAPEPASVALVATGLVGIAGLSRRRKKVSV